MARLELTSHMRTDFRKSETKRIRREGGIPATVYGRALDSVSVAIPEEAFTDILKTRGGRLSIIDLRIEDAKSKKPFAVMIQDVQRDPVSKRILHVDLHQIKMDEPVTARVPVQLVGEAPGVKQGGILEHLTREIEMKALPDSMPNHIEVDVSSLDLSDIVHVSDIKLPEGAELTAHTSPDSVVVTVRQPIVRAEEPGAEAATPAAEAAAE